MFAVCVACSVFVVVRWAVFLCVELRSRCVVCLDLCFCVCGVYVVVRVSLCCVLVVCVVCV